MIFILHILQMELINAYSIVYTYFTVIRVFLWHLAEIEMNFVFCINRC